MKQINYKIILIVDDEPKNLHTIIDIFAKSNLPYKIINSPNGKIALNLVEKKLPDLIITDWKMPEMDGIEFIKQLKKKDKTKDIPVIMCTGIMTSSENLETALNAGAVDYIRKPVDKIELIARTKANLHLSESYKKIKELNKAKSNILTIIAHDLKSPVGSIKSFINLIIKKQYNFDHAKIMEFIPIMGKQITSVYNILENLLEWSNSLRNNITYNPVKQEIDIAVCENLELLENLANKKNISIINKINNDILAYFDSTLISTVIRNLIANSIKFTSDNGSITIYAEKKQSEIIISVSDTGVGIPSETITKIFNKTSYETTFGTNSEEGSGLGLKICSDFVAKHKGKIWVESKEGIGSTFSFTIPNIEDK